MIRATLIALIWAISASAIGSTRLELDWRRVTVQTAAGDVLNVLNGENATAISLMIAGKLFVVDKNLPPPGALVPGTIKVEYEATADAGHKDQPKRIVSMQFSPEDVEDRTIFVEYHFSAKNGLCEFYEFDEAGNTVRFESYCAK